MSDRDSDAIAYVDESGEQGLSRRLTAARDSEIGLMCCLDFPADRLQEYVSAYKNGFHQFCAASPVGEKIHITDAFRPGNEAWGQVARRVRDEFFELLRHQEIPAIYDARHLSLQREEYGRVEELKKAAKDAKRSPISISERPSDDRVERQLIEGLTLKLDALAAEFDLARVDLHFDELDTELARYYERTIEQLRNISYSCTEIKGWDSDAKIPVKGSISFQANASFQLGVTHIGKVKVVGKNDPLVLATDMVANALYYHLRNLPQGARLNAPSSISSWELGDRIWGVREDAIEDII